MENVMYTAPLDMADQNSTCIEDNISQHLTPKPLIYCYAFDLNNQNHIINGIPILSGEQGEPISNDQVNGHFMNPVTIANSDSFVASQGKTIVVGNASNSIDNSNFQDHLARGMPIPCASVPARISLQENLENSASLEALGPYVFNNWQETTNPLSSTFCGSGYDEVLPSNGKWSVNKLLKASEPDLTGFLAYSSLGNMDPNGWTSSNVADLSNHAYNSSNCSNDLSLSLASSPNGCSDMSCSDITHSNMEVSMMGSNKRFQFSPAIMDSRYLAGIQEILIQIATYSFENLEEVNYSATGVRGGGNKSPSAFTPKRMIARNHNNANYVTEAHGYSPLHGQAAESIKSQLLKLLQLVDSRYSQCMDEVHTVVAAFHAATELDPHIHAHFALQTISLLYKDLRERISTQILSMGSNFNSPCSEEEKEWSLETSFVQKQWAIQQLKRKDQLWRPQRGLPERSVSVLRTWMFQNFLHPYPKEAEKHLLAVKSGLTRSQVSNWFINARVRLWKPMIDEMYAEMSRRKACRNEEGNETSHKSRRIGINNQMFHIN